jgi:hypothetical protein
MTPGRTARGHRANAPRAPYGPVGRPSCPSTATRRGTVRVDIFFALAQAAPTSLRLCSTPSIPLVRNAFGGARDGCGGLNPGRPGRVYSGSLPWFFAETVAYPRFAMHSGVMQNSGGNGRYWWCLRHSRVETDQNLCPSVHRLGPYATATEAERALTTVAERNAKWDAEDARWTGEEP